jgi:antitoxin VapB
LPLPGHHFMVDEVEHMSLNIKNEETHKLASQLARITGESVSEAVGNAVRERLDRVQGERGRGLANRLVKIGEECAAHLKEPFRSKAHGDLLYDEKGLPK